MDNLFDNETSDWIECVRPFFPNDVPLARKALRGRMGNPTLPDWMFSLLVMVLFDGIAYEETRNQYTNARYTSRAFAPYKDTKLSQANADFLNDGHTMVYKYPDEYPQRRDKF
tara:strand:+ start:45 stop:383 length:339 start_codon:yes stop_codon:yes gene_type:complete